MIRPPFPHETPRIAKALRRFARLGDEWWTLDSLLDDLDAGTREAWIVADGRAVAITRTIGGKVFFVDAIEGEGLAEWGDDFHAAILAEAKRRGLKEVACRARRGWARFGALHGWRETHREYRARVA